jgi:hypothetical protein
MKTKLEAGKLYQVKHWEKGWIIAEYMCEVPAHSYKYNNIYMDTMTTGPEKVKHEPLSHRWRKIGYGSYSVFTVEDKKMETRPVTQEAVDTIANLKAYIKRLEEELSGKRKELQVFCN